MVDGTYANTPIQLTDQQLLQNIQAVQGKHCLYASRGLSDFMLAKPDGTLAAANSNYVKDALAVAPLNLDVEMETGTGKTYCYLKTMHELNKKYGWSKYIIIVPSIAVREAVYSALGSMRDHFAELYGSRPRHFRYDSSRLHEIDAFAGDPGISIIIMTIHSFNSRARNNLRMFERLDEFQSRRPIDVIASTRPILVLDEPQNMEGSATLETLTEFHAPCALRYSATHRHNHLKVYRLDPMDAFDRRLVKRISVTGIEPRDGHGRSTYIYLDSIEERRDGLCALLELDTKSRSGRISRRKAVVRQGQDLEEVSHGLAQYAGHTIAQLNYRSGSVEFGNGLLLTTGQVVGDVTSDDMRRIQVRETIKAHLARERCLYGRGIKVLSLFFIDEVASYRDYSAPSNQGPLAQLFETEYKSLVEEVKRKLGTKDADYQRYLEDIDVADTHQGYFSIDKKSGRFTDGDHRKGTSRDVVAYDLILKNKERLLSLNEHCRFIFSHSALREGWDNPNVFVICFLRAPGRLDTRRQEVGRGLRLCVDQQGDRIDAPETVHEDNILTVVTNETYDNFVADMQRETDSILAARPTVIDQDYLSQRALHNGVDTLVTDDALARKLFIWTIRHSYVNDEGQLTDTWYTNHEMGTLEDLPDDLRDYTEQVHALLDAAARGSQAPPIENGRQARQNPLNQDNFARNEFQTLWNHISHKGLYQVDYDSDELIVNCVADANRNLKVSPIQFTVKRGEQSTTASTGNARAGEFHVSSTNVDIPDAPPFELALDLVGEVAANTHLTRKTVASILSQMDLLKFDQYATNPRRFIEALSTLIRDQIATLTVEKVTYDVLLDRHDVEIFTKNQLSVDFGRASDELRHHILDYAILDSKVEREFVKELDASSDVTVYAKLPSGFYIPTPVGNYTPDWAIAFKEGHVKHVYFVAETKGSLSSLQLRSAEEAKIACARKFFDKLNEHIGEDKVKYDVVTNYHQLMDLVR